MSILSAWRKGDLVRMPNGEEFRLTSEGYYCDTRQKVICDTDRGKPISYMKLIDKAYLVETGSGRKNETIKQSGGGIGGCSPDYKKRYNERKTIN